MVEKDVNSIKNTFTKNRKTKKKWSKSTEQASNETVAKNSWRYLFVNQTDISTL